MGPWATWSSGWGPCPWQRVGTSLDMLFFFYSVGTFFFPQNIFQNIIKNTSIFSNSTFSVLTKVMNYFHILLFPYKLLFIWNRKLSFRWIIHLMHIEYKYDSVIAHAFSKLCSEGQHWDPWAGPKLEWIEAWWMWINNPDRSSASIRLELCAIEDRYISILKLLVRKFNLWCVWRYIFKCTQEKMYASSSQ